jgi:hypothetical protein
MSEREAGTPYPNGTPAPDEDYYRSILRQLDRMMTALDDAGAWPPELGHQSVMSNMDWLEWKLANAAEPSPRQVDGDAPGMIPQPPEPSQ